MLNSGPTLGAAEKKTVTFKVQTTGATPLVVWTSPVILDETSAEVEISVTAKTSATGDSRLDKATALYMRTGGALTLVDLSQITHLATAGAEAWGGPTFATSTTKATVSVTGLAATVINWEVKITTLPPQLAQ